VVRGLGRFIECRGTTLGSVDLDVLTTSDTCRIKKFRTAHENDSSPLPLIFWNHGVTRGLWLRSLIPKELRAKYKNHCSYRLFPHLFSGI